MDLLGIGQANCFRTHNELTMGLLGKCPLAPSVSRLNVGLGAESFEFREEGFPECGSLLQLNELGEVVLFAIRDSELLDEGCREEFPIVEVIIVVNSASDRGRNLLCPVASGILRDKGAGKEDSRFR